MKQPYGRMSTEWVPSTSSLNFMGKNTNVLAVRDYILTWKDPHPITTNPHPANTYLSNTHPTRTPPTSAPQNSFPAPPSAPSNPTPPTPSLPHTNTPHHQPPCHQTSHSTPTYPTTTHPTHFLIGNVLSTLVTHKFSRLKCLFSQSVYSMFSHIFPLMVSTMKVSTVVYLSLASDLVQRSSPTGRCLHVPGIATTMSED